MQPNLTKLFEHHLDVAPPLDAEKLLEIPAKRGVVMLATEDAPIVMITAASIRQRLKNRLDEPLEGVLKKTADLRQVTRRIFWTQTFSEFETDLMFLQIARKLWGDTYSKLIAWKPANFVYAGIYDEYPRFSVVRSNADFNTDLTGPFGTNKQAEGFVNCLNDIFDLCREYRCLRQYPESQGCAYRQMKKCVGVCCGDISLEEYRKLFRKSFELCGGGLGEVKNKFESDMKTAAGNLDFEQAAKIKKNIDRLEEYIRSVRGISRIISPFEKFRFISIQSGSRFNQARVFLINQAIIKPVGEIEFPVKEKDVDKILAKMEKLVSAGQDFDKHSANCIGLTASYLFSSDRKKGLILRYDEKLTAEKIIESINNSVKILKLREPKKRKSNKDKEPESEKPINTNQSE